MPDLSHNIMINQNKSHIGIWKPVPDICMIELTNSCNFSCTMCANKLMKREKGFMSPDIFKKTLNKCKDAGIQKIKLYTIGESMLHTKFMEFFRLANTYPFKEIMISTNGSMLTKDIMKEIVKSEKLKIQFSFNGWNKQSYESRYKGGNFEDTVQKIKDMTKHIKEAGLPKNTLTINGVISKTTGVTKKSKAFFKKELGLDENQINIHNAHNWNEVIEKDIIKQRDGKNYYCHIANTRIGVLYDGRVTVCGCLDVNAELIIGDITKNTISEIRTGELFSEYKSKLKSGKIDNMMCYGCNALKEINANK